MSYIGNKPYNGKIQSGNIVDGTITSDDLQGDLTLNSLDVNGTVTADGLTVDGDATVDSVEFTVNTSFPTVGTTLNANGFSYEMTGSQGKIFRSSGNTKALMQIGSDGDFHLYEDTGTTAKMVWSSGGERLDLSGTQGSQLRLDARGGSGTYWEFDSVYGTSNPQLNIKNNSLTAMSIDSSGRVGIGTASPASDVAFSGGVKLQTEDDTNTGYSGSGSGRLPSGTQISTRNAVASSSSLSGIGMLNRGPGGASMGSYIGSLSASSGWGANIVFGSTSGSSSHAEHMRLDNSGNLLVGTTTSSAHSNQTSGHVLGQLFATQGYQVANVGSTFVNSGFAVGNTRGTWLITVQGSAPSNGSSIATYIFTKAAYDAELVQLGNTAAHYHNVYVEAQLDSGSSPVVNLQVRFTGSNLTGTGTISTNVLRLG